MCSDLTKVGVRGVGTTCTGHINSLLFIARMFSVEGYIRVCLSVWSIVKNGCCPALFGLKMFFFSFVIGLEWFDRWKLSMEDVRFLGFDVLDLLARGRVSIDIS